VPLIDFSGRFPKRAVRACVEAMSDGRLRSSLVNDVLKYSNVDVTPIEQFLSSRDEIIRLNAVRIIGQRGDVSKLVDMALVEQNVTVVSEILRYVSRSPEKVDRLVELLVAQDSVVREQAIQMFRRAGRSDCMLPLLFDGDDSLVSRVKRYMEETNHDDDSSSTNRA